MAEDLLSSVVPRNPTPIPPLAPSDKKITRDLLFALKPFLNLRSLMPFPCVAAFLLVATEEGKSASSYAFDMGVARMTMWRYLYEISDKIRNGHTGLGLVVIEEHPTNSQMRQVFLTAKGRHVAEQMLKPLRKPMRRQRTAVTASDRPSPI
jgi:hypothetical protein